MSSSLAGAPVCRLKAIPQYLNIFATCIERFVSPVLETAVLETACDTSSRK